MQCTDQAVIQKPGDLHDDDDDDGGDYDGGGDDDDHDDDDGDDDDWGGLPCIALALQQADLSLAPFLTRE